MSLPSALDEAGDAEGVAEAEDEVVVAATREGARASPASIILLMSGLRSRLKKRLQ